MKRTILSLAMMLTAALAAQAITYTQARDEALFLTDKMAYELGLNESQYDAAYEINLDYLMTINGRDDIYSTPWYRRNLDLSHILTAAQYNLYCTLEHFYRPVYWNSGLRHRIYTRYTDRTHFYYPRPTVYITYRGGHSWTLNNGHSWYKGRKFTSGKPMTTTVTGTNNSRSHSVNRNTNVTVNRNINVNRNVSINHNVTVNRNQNNGSKPTVSRGTSTAKRNASTVNRNQSNNKTSSSGHSGTFGGARK